MYYIHVVSVVPSYSKVCPHDNITINCTTYTGDLKWFDGHVVVSYSLLMTKSLPYEVGAFYITNIADHNGVLSSTVVLYNATMTKSISCLNGQYGGANVETVTATIDISGI